MEHALVTTLVVITLLQLCRAQSTSPSPEWYAANDVNDINFSPKPITELFSTETSFSPENPIVVLPPSTREPSDSGVDLSSQRSVPDATEPSAVIPLSSTERPSSPSFSASLPITTSSDQESTRQSTASQGTSSTPQQTSSTDPTPRQSLSPSSNQNQQSSVRFSEPNNSQNIVQQPISPNVNQPNPIFPSNILLSLPQLPQLGNRNNLSQPYVGQPNYIVLYQQAPQQFLSLPQSVSQPPQQAQTQSIPQAMSPSVKNLPSSKGLNNFPVTQSNGQQPNFQRQPNIIRQSNVQRTWNNQLQPNNQQQNTQPQPINQTPNNLQPFNQYRNNQQPFNLPPNNQQPFNLPPNNQQPFNLPPNNQQPFNPPPNNQQPFNPPPNNLQPFNQPPINQQPNISRPRQRNRLNGGYRIRPNGNIRPNTFPCNGTNSSMAQQNGTLTRQQNRSSVITILLPPKSRTNFNLHRTPVPIAPTTTPRKPRPQVNDKNYERCLNSCRDKKDRICATPDNVVPLNPNNLKGFPSMCHMACYNTFRANPIYEKVTNGRCGKLRTRIQTIDKNKVRREELNKAKYTIISNAPGTVVELDPLKD